MADAPVVHIAENSAEQIAYKLFMHIVEVEKKCLNSMVDLRGRDLVDRKWILETYAQCVNAVKNPNYHLE